MANTYIKPEKRIALALALLHKRSRLSGLVTRYDGNAHVGARGDQLYYETKGITRARDYTFRTRSEPIIFDEIYKTRLSITLNQHMYQGVKFTDEEEKFDLTSYRTEILTPQMEAIAERFDSKIETALSSYTGFKTADLEIDVSADPEGKRALRVALQLKQQADRDGVPKNGRFLVAGSEVFNYFVASGAVVAYDSSQALTAFREGVFGKIAGFELVDGDGVMGSEEFSLIHPSWNVMGNASPVVPDGVSWGARQAFEGWSLRVIRDYDSSYLQDRSIVNTFWGMNPIADEYARHTSASATAAADGSEAGDIIIVDGEPQISGKNVRGLKGHLVLA